MPLISLFDTVSMVLIVLPKVAKASKAQVTPWHTKLTCWPLAASLVTQFSRSNLTHLMTILF
jgi:hypothetical protein